MPGFRIYLFEKLSVMHGEQALGGLDGSKVRELLCYLLLHRTRSHAREALAALLWPDCPTSQSKKNLRQTLWQLQAALHPDDETDDTQLLVVGADWIALNDAVDLWLDVTEFERGFVQCHGMPGPQLDQRAAQQLHGASGLYRGDLLQGWYQDWCLCERERLQDMYVRMLDKLMNYSESQHDYEAGIAYGLQILRYNRAHERTHRRLMRLYYLADDRASALRQYQRCTDALQEELGVLPSRRTLAVYQQIRSDRFEEPNDPGSGLADTAAMAPRPTRAADLAQQLRGLSAAFAECRRQIDQALNALGDR